MDAWSYIYDAEGARIGKGTLSAAPGGYTATCAPPLGAGFTLTARYLVDLAGDQVTELTEQGLPTPQTEQWAHSNVWAAGRLTATYDTLGVHYSLTDPLGTKRVQANALGQVDETCTSLPFGNEAGNPVGASCAPTPNSLGTAGDATEHHFTGKVRDSETGNDYFLARYYSSALGRFTTPDWSAKTDPVPYAVFTDPQSLNLYAYVRNNPLTRVDADGHCWGGGWCDIHSNPYQTDSEKNAAKKQAQQQSKEVNTVYNETSGLRPDTASDPNSAQNLQTARQNVAHVYENTNGNGFQSSDQLSGREKSAIKNGDPTATASMASSQQAVAAAHQDRTDPTHGATHIYLYDLSPNSTQRVPAWVRNGNPTTVQGPFINAAGGGDVRAGSLVLILTIKDQR